MRCRLRPIGRVALSALPIVLGLTVTSPTVFAQSSVCYAIRQGESAIQVARRITGDGQNTYKAGFQIMNPSSRFIPKSQYDRVRAGWRACVIKPAIAGATSIATPVKAADAPDAAEASNLPEARAALVAPSPVATDDARDGGGDPMSVASEVLRWLGTVNLTLVWLGAAMVVPLVWWRILDDYLALRKTESIVVRHFADRFIREFERPLVQYHDAEHPVRSRLRLGARRGRFDILLAPCEGRHYPNLSDHKKNVEYDVTRVLHVLADQSFVRGRLYAHAGWVVVPFQFKTYAKQAGVACISSF